MKIEIYMPEHIPSYERTELIGEWMIEHNGWRTVQWDRVRLCLIVTFR